MQQTRELSDRIGERVGGAAEIRAQRHVRTASAPTSASGSGKIYGIRFDIYKRKFFVKFLNNFLAQITPFFFYAVGGYFVIMGDLSLGALVAVLAAYKDILDAVEGAPQVVLDEGGRPRQVRADRLAVRAAGMSSTRADGERRRRRSRRSRARSPRPA